MEKQISEFGLIDIIKKNFKNHNANCSVGIGDDAAEISNTHPLLITTDTLAENVHFKRNTINMQDLGYKALSISVSDIASMGGQSLFALASVGLTPNTSIKEFKAILKGIKSLTNKLNIQLIGGNIVKSQKHMFIASTVIGKTLGKNAITRKNAQIGDLVFVTGPFGDSAFGLECIKKNIKNIYFIKKHNKPVPKHKEGMIIGKNNLANSMMDASDGLYFTLKDIAKQSNVGIKVILNFIPISKKLQKSCTKQKSLNMALFGGEDYELVFTAKQKNLKKIKDLMPYIQVIGEVTKKKGLHFLNNKNKKINITGKYYDHFSNN